MSAGRPFAALSGDAAFRRAVRQGTRRATPLMVVHIYERPAGGRRLGLIVGRAFGTAVRRNRLRRRLREAVRALYEVFPAHADVVVSPKPAAATATVEDLRAALITALRVVDASRAAEQQER